MNYYIDPLKKYFVFSGRASRAEYWYFFLFNFVILFALGFIEGFLGIFSQTENSVFGIIYNLLLSIRKSTVGDNQYGSNPTQLTSSESSEVNKSTAAKYCVDCGKILEKEAKFCTHCGSKTK